MNHNMMDGSHPGLRPLLLDLARRVDDLAAREAASTPYWAPCPDSVVGRRTAAAVLRAEADLLLTRDAS